MSTRTIAEVHVEAVKAQLREVLEASALVEAATRQLRAANERRQRAYAVLGSLHQLLGLEPTKVYRFTEAKTKNRYLAEPVTDEQVQALEAARAKAVAARQAQGAPPAVATVPAPAGGEHGAGPAAS